MNLVAEICRALDGGSLTQCRLHEAINEALDAALSASCGGERQRRLAAEMLVKYGRGWLKLVHIADEATSAIAYHRGHQFVKIGTWLRDAYIYGCRRVRQHESS